MKLGISTASLYPLETEKSLETLGKSGIPVTEIFFNSQSEITTDFFKLLDKIRREYGIEINSIHPCGSMSEPYYLFSEYMRRFYDTFDIYKRYFEAAEMLGAKTVVLHGDSLKGHISMEEYCKRLMTMNSEAEKYGVSLSHENVNKYRAATVENIKMINRLTDGKMKYTFDVKQTVRAGEEAYAVYGEMGTNVINVHISDNCENETCLLPGKGSFDLVALFSWLERDKYDGSCLIEVYRNCYSNLSDLLESYQFVKNIHKFY